MLLKYQFVCFFLNLFTPSFHGDFLCKENGRDGELTQWWSTYLAFCKALGSIPRTLKSKVLVTSDSLVNAVISPSVLGKLMEPELLEMREEELSTMKVRMERSWVL